MADPDPGIAVAALIVSIASATVTLAGLTWQLVLYRLSGARLKVELTFGYANDWGMTFTSTSREAPVWREHKAANPNQMELTGIEFGLVRVTNIGRTAVSVENISFDIAIYRHILDMRRYSWKNRRNRHTITTEQFVDKNRQRQTVDTSAPHRLEPGGHLTLAFHLWPPLARSELVPDQCYRDMIVRGSATAVGRRATRSARKTAWRFPFGAQSRFSDLNPPPRETRVYRVLFQHGIASPVGDLVLLFHREVLHKLMAGASAEELREWLDDHNSDGIHHMLAHEAHHAFHNTTHPWWPDPPPPPPPLSWDDRVHRVLWGQSPRR